MKYLKEHPDFNAPDDFDFLQLAKLGYEDISWRNDSFPFFGNYSTGYKVGVDYPQEQSDFPSLPERYHLFKSEGQEWKKHHCLHDESEHIFSTNSFEEILTKIQTTKT